MPSVKDKYMTQKKTNEIELNKQRELRQQQQEDLRNLLTEVKLLKEQMTTSLDRLGILEECISKQEKKHEHIKNEHQNLVDVYNKGQTELTEVLCDIEKRLSRIECNSVI